MQKDDRRPMAFALVRDTQSVNVDLVDGGAPSASKMNKKRKNAVTDAELEKLFDYSDAHPEHRVEGDRIPRAVGEVGAITDGDPERRRDGREREGRRDPCGSP